MNGVRAVWQAVRQASVLQRSALASAVGVVAGGVFAQKARAEGCSVDTAPRYSRRFSYITDLEALPPAKKAAIKTTRPYALEIVTPSGSARFSVEELSQARQEVCIGVLQRKGKGEAGNVKFKGVRLLDLLGSVSHPENHFLSVEQLDDQGKVVYAVEIPFKDLPKETLLVLEMNEERLPPEHGAPLRLFVPGCYSHFSVKRPDRIRVVEGTLTPQPFHLKPAALVLDPSFQIWPTTPLVPLSGWAWTGGGRKVSAVEISKDQGKTWERVSCSNDSYKYAWSLWTHWTECPKSPPMIRVVE